MIPQQLRIFLRILCVPVILSHSPYGRVSNCNENGGVYECVNMNLAEVELKFEEFDKVLILKIIGIFLIGLKDFNF